MIPVEDLVRKAVTGVSNAYCLVFFACCREVQELSKFEIEKLFKKKLIKPEAEKVVSDMRSLNAVESRKIGNFIFSFGCQPSFGLIATTKYVENLKQLLTSNFDQSGCIIFPDVFSKVLSSDAIFETVSSNLSRKLKLQRQDNIVGPKILIYAIDSADKSRFIVRALTKNFFIKCLGFKKDEIIEVERNEFRSKKTAQEN